MAYGGVIRGMKHGESLETFMDREVRPNGEYLREMGRVVDFVVFYLQQNANTSRWSIKEIVKGGSLGKGTGVRGKSDVDLLIVINNMNINDLKRNMRDLLTHLKSVTVQSLKSKPAATLQNMKETQFSVQFDLKVAGYDEIHSVDLLPVADLSHHGKDEIYQEMKEEYYKNRSYYAASLAKVQIEFIQQRPPKLKDVIRFIKYWAKTNEVDIVSYGLELIVIDMWEEQRSPNDMRLKQLVQATAEKLGGCQQLALSWNRNYDLRDYEAVARMNKPYIRDPANPFMNVIYHTRYPRDVEQEACQLLSALHSM